MIKLWENNICNASPKKIVFSVLFTRFCSPSCDQGRGVTCSFSRQQLILQLATLFNGLWSKQGMADNILWAITMVRLERLSNFSNLTRTGQVEGSCPTILSWPQLQTMIKIMGLWFHLPSHRINNRCQDFTLVFLVHIFLLRKKSRFLSFKYIKNKSRRKREA